MSVTLTAEQIATYTLTESHDRYSTYLDAEGNALNVAPSGLVLVTSSELDLAGLWHDFKYTYGYRHNTFLRQCQEKVIDPEALEGMRFCAYCDNAVMLPGQWHEVERGSAMVCNACIRYYRNCTNCETLSNNLAPIMGDEDTRLCAYCRETSCYYCDNCDGYYYHEDRDEHRHDGCRTNCVSPKLEFSIPNGDGRLTAGEQHEVTLPAGIISGEAMEQIRRHVQGLAVNLDSYDNPRRNDLYAFGSSTAAIEEAIGLEWTGRRGNFPKRLSNHINKQYQIKLPTELLATIGTLARENSGGAELTIDITRDLNLPPEEFANEESCWWQSYYASRCTLKSNGGFGLRSFEGNNVIGRAWVLPLKVGRSNSLTPTFKDDPDAYVVFNGYGDMTGFTPSRLLASMVGMTYRRIRFECSPMYVNSNSGYLVAPEDLATAYEGGRLLLNLSDHADLFTTEERELTHVV